jgi:protein-S-isoprenylcysteine O-methyltransferase Ste14
MGRFKREAMRHFFEAVSTFLLFSTQYVLNAGMFISIMALPLLSYLYLVFSGNVHLDFELEIMFLSPQFMIGRAIAFSGILILLLAAGQLLWNRHKGVKLIRTGFYAKVRHPQFTGIIITVIGLNVMVFTNGSFQEPIPIPSTNERLLFLQNELLIITLLWVLQIFGYILLAKFEEWRLTKKLGESYLEYKREVPFLFPIKSPRRIPEMLFTAFIVVLIALVFVLLPWNAIRTFSNTLFR